MNALQHQHPRTLLGAAYLALAPAGDAPALRRKAVAADQLGYHRQARRLWEQLAQSGDAQAQYRLALLGEQRATL